MAKKTMEVPLIALRLIETLIQVFDMKITPVN